jgi:hypothetical protein
VAYVAAGDKLYRRTAAGTQFSEVTAYTGEAVKDIAMDPDDWARVYLLAGDGLVWRTTDAGDTWTDVSGDPNGGKASNSVIGFEIETIEIFGRTSAGGDEVVFIGGRASDASYTNGFRTGVFAAESFGADTTQWVPFGTNLPRVTVNDLYYSPEDNLLVASVIGRGIWTVGSLSDLRTSTVPRQERGLRRILLVVGGLFRLLTPPTLPLWTLTRRLFRRPCSFCTRKMVRRSRFRSTSRMARG